MMIKQSLEAEVEQWGLLGHPAIQQRFVLAKGREYQGRVRPKEVPKMPDKNCFQNSNVLAEMLDYTYVEGYALSPGIPLLVHHAWCVDPFNRVVDATWRNPEKSFYFGVPFRAATVEQETARTGCYSILAGELVINHEYIFAQCPDILGVVEAMRRKRKCETVQPVDQR